MPVHRCEVLLKKIEDAHTLARERQLIVVAQLLGMAVLSMTEKEMRGELCPSCELRGGGKNRVEPSAA